jgi:hypothetical protein
MNRRAFLRNLGLIAPVAAVRPGKLLTAAGPPVTVFQEPEAGFDYTIGVGTTVVSVWRKGTKTTPDIQCAEYVGTASMVCEVLPALVKKYAPTRQPLVAILPRMLPVHDLHQTLRRRGHTRFVKFHMYDTRKIPTAPKKRGWRTPLWSRPMVSDAFTYSVQNRWAIIQSPDLLDALRDTPRSDLVTAAAFAVFSTHDMEALVERGKRSNPDQGGA